MTLRLETKKALVSAWNPVGAIERPREAPALTGSCRVLVAVGGRWRQGSRTGERSAGIVQASIVEGKTKMRFWEEAADS